MTTPELQARLAQITTFVFDVDGVMTDGSVHVLQTGEHFRTFFIRDGYALERAVQAGYTLCVITGGKHEGVRIRMQNLGAKYLYMGSGGKSKASIYEGFLEESGITETQILYMGDDVPDYEVMCRPDLLSTCPADACTDILAVAQYVAKHAGGRGAVREVIEMVMQAQGKW